MKIFCIVFCAFLALAFASCKTVEPVKPDADPYADVDFIVYSAFDASYNTMKFSAYAPLEYSVATNPQREGINTSKKCGRVVSAGGEWEFVYSELYGRKFDFTKNRPIFKMKVLAPKSGAKVYFKLEPPHTDTDTKPIEIQNVATSKSGEWEELVFDFGSFSPESNVYQKFVILFDAGVASSGEEWYFDDIVGPSDDLTEISLFQRCASNPVFAPTGSGWNEIHMANGAIITADSSPDGKWLMYIRGSGYSGGIGHNQIGLYTQSADKFNPFGPWQEYQSNPVVRYGAAGAFDELHLLDTSPVVGKDGVIYLYYKAYDNNEVCRMGCAYSTDGYNFTKYPEYVLANGGICSAIYYDDKYYLFVGPWVYVSDNPLDFNNCKRYDTVGAKGGPSNFDSYIIHGSNVFRLNGVDKWFLAYQGSAVHNDFPDRFHIAYSDDLVNWTKVQNTQPLFTRGSAGEWDQGGIWCPEIFEYEEMLYLYYEGWGREGFTDDRNKPYFVGCSSEGAASVSKDKFLEWCGIF